MIERKYLPLAAAFVLAGFSLAASTEPAKAPASSPAATTRPASNAGDVPSPRLDKYGNPDANWMKRHEAYVALTKKGGVDLYFIGDSITDAWHGGGKEVWNKEFGAWKPENFGISGDQTQNVLWRLQNGELAGVSPKVFVVMIGTNNRGPNTNDEIVAGNKAILKEIQSQYPTAKILLLGIFPCWISRQDHALQPRIKAINALLGKLDDGKNVKYLDIGDKFLVNGELPADIMSDGLHPSEKGYRIWADAINPTLTEWLGSKKENPLAP